MWKIIFIMALIYFICIFFSFISEITYKKRAPKLVLKDYKRIWIKSSLIFLVFLAGSIFYYKIGVKFNP